MSLLISLILLVFLSGYTSAQWLAGRKFLFGAFHLAPLLATLLFGFTIIFYSSVGGFRGSIYADTVQAVIRLAGTLLALGAMSYFCWQDQPAFHTQIAAAGGDFLALFPNASLLSVGGFFAGYAAAALGFGLGQPQIVSRYFAGKNPAETKCARWIYIFFLQFTWIAMTLFGILLRGVMPGLDDPEAGLGAFFQSHMGAIATGIIVADIFATIASTTNGLLISMAQIAQYDLLPKRLSVRLGYNFLLTLIVVVAGCCTVGLSLALPGNVFSIAIGAVSLSAAAIAGSVMIKVMGWRHSAGSLLAAVLTGLVTSVCWKILGFDQVLNEAFIGIALSLAANGLVVRLTRHPAEKP